jgi:ABC-type transport system substrate-binding protein
MKHQFLQLSLPLRPPRPLRNLCVSLHKIAGIAPGFLPHFGRLELETQRSRRGRGGRRGYFLSLVAHGLLVLFFGFCTAPTAFAADKIGVGVPYTVSRIDPLVLNEPVNRLLLANTAMGLTALDDNGLASLEAAQELTSKKHGTEWLVALRPDARFPSLRLVTAEDVRRSVEYFRSQLELAQSTRARLAGQLPLPGAPPPSSIQASPSGLALLADKLDQIEAVEVKKPKSNERTQRGVTELSFTLKHASSDFPRILSLVPIIDTEVASIFGAEFGAGTNCSFLGPYQVRESRDQRIVLERVPDFYRAGKPVVSVLELVRFADAESALRALRVGAIDIIALPTAAQLADLEEDPTLIALRSPYVNLAQLTGPWVLNSKYWSQENDEADLLKTDTIIVRKTLHLDQAALSRFDLSGTFLP